MKCCICTPHGRYPLGPPRFCDLHLEEKIKYELDRKKVTDELARVLSENIVGQLKEEPNGCLHGSMSK